VPVKRRRQSRPRIPPGCVDRVALLKAIVRDRNRVDWQNPVINDIRYPEFLLFFRKAATLTPHHLIIGANFVYGWMPTMLDFRSKEFKRCVIHLERARKHHDLGTDELEELAGLVNNSNVGASKLLHVVAPEHYSIWDRRVAEYLETTPATNRTAGAEQYLNYNNCCRSLASSREAIVLARELSAHVGCSLTPLRALELVMFYASGDGRTYRK
jgi:hypothetical protein